MEFYLIETIYCWKYQVIPPAISVKSSSTETETGVSLTYAATLELLLGNASAAYWNLVKQFRLPERLRTLIWLLAGVGYRVMIIMPRI
jgi:hypothetical protein